MRPLPWALLGLFALAACASDPARQKRYEALQQEQRSLREELARVSVNADRAFSEATSAERQSGNFVNGANRCAVPKGVLRPSAPLTFGPLRFKYKDKTFFLSEGASFETRHMQCVQEAVSSR